MRSSHCSLTVFFSVESSKSSLPKDESKKEDTISPGRSTVDGKLSGDRKPDQSERTKEVGTQVGESESGLKDLSSNKNTLAEGAGESKKKGDIPAKVEILPVQGEPDNNVDLNSLRYFF